MCVHFHRRNQSQSDSQWACQCDCIAFKSTVKYDYYFIPKAKTAQLKRINSVNKRRKIWNSLEFVRAKLTYSLNLKWALNDERVNVVIIYGGSHTCMHTMTMTVPIFENNYIWAGAQRNLLYRRKCVIQRWSKRCWLPHSHCSYIIRNDIVVTWR